VCAARAVELTPWDINIDEEARSGTLITLRKTKKWNKLCRSIAFNRDEAKVTVLGVPTSRHRRLDSWPRSPTRTSRRRDHPERLARRPRPTFPFTVHRKRLCTHAATPEEHRAAATGAAQVMADAKSARSASSGIGMRFARGVASKDFR